MVSALAFSQIEPNVPFVELPADELKWCTVSLRDIKKANMRLEASVFEIEGKHAREQIYACNWETINLAELLRNAYYPGRFKRTYCNALDGVPFFMPSQLTDINPKPDKFISSLSKCNISELRLKKGDILLTRSGTIGSVTFVSKTLENTVFSDDVIRITTNKTVDIGFLYTYLKSKIGNTILQTNGYGSVITHIEPEHLADIPIPNPPDNIKKKIHDFVIRSFELRDESNELINEATTLLVRELQLPSIEQFKVKKFSKKAETNNYNIKLSNLSGRIDASFHVPIVNTIVEHLRKYADEVTTIGDTRISKRIILPGRFKRVYVEEGQGRVFFGGKQIFELDPSSKKYLSLSKHSNRIKAELEISENTILISRSGTIGKVTITPRHWEHWIASDHIIRIIPSGKEIAGYLYVFLVSDFGNCLIKRYTYGSVVDEIDDNHVAQIPFPLLRNKSVQAKINTLALEANRKRYEAYILEQNAMKILNNEVIYAKF